MLALFIHTFTPMLLPRPQSEIADAAASVMGGLGGGSGPSEHYRRLTAKFVELDARK
jgi:hypothetical protein